MRLTGILAALLLSASAALADAADIQVSLHSDKAVYRPGEAIRLRYEALWLGRQDGEIHINALKFPVIEVSYLNRFPVAFRKTGRVAVRSLPGRHEIRLFAPTMSGYSAYFTINAPDDPLSMINGTKGYFQLMKAGAYVLTVRFPHESGWHLYAGQDGDVVSNSIVVQVGP